MLPLINNGSSTHVNCKRTLMLLMLYCAVDSRVSKWCSLLVQAKWAYVQMVLSMALERQVICM